MDLKLKICGMKFPDNIKEIASLNPDFLGFIFFEKSKRNFDIDSIPEIDKNIKKVGVFVDATIEFIVEKIKKFQLNYIQLHGNEDESFCLDIKRYFKENQLDVKIIKVFLIDDNFDFTEMNKFDMVDYFLFDTAGVLRGGNGVKFNWEILNKYSSNKYFFLSGGIGIDDVNEIKKIMNSDLSSKLFAIDVNSKFEIEPGLKNKIVLQEFKKQLYDF